MVDNLKSAVDNSMGEAEFQQAIVDLAELCGWLVFHDYDSRRNRAGFPDLVMARNGQVIFAEVKTEKGKVRPEQQEWADALRTCYLWRPSHWGTIVDTLR